VNPRAGLGIRAEKSGPNSRDLIAGPSRLYPVTIPTGLSRRTEHRTNEFENVNFMCLIMNPFENQSRRPVTKTRAAQHVATANLNICISAI